ncbi:hypothetical protein [Bacillus niameyensis]|uniref:hypothetical protein n=1 Tax=Bacillus niameyensis TaxID=1522308 RepID=UPI00078357AF|nr:hypothetical protein [Bacillus niameyensis]
MIPSSTFAANIKDEPFSFHVTVSNKSGTTKARAKENTTSTYVEVTQTPGSVINMDVQGFRPTSGSGTNYWVNETLGGTVMLLKGEWRVKQTGYENGGRSARLRFEKYGNDGIVSGRWSPDSVGSAPHVN